MTLALAKWRNLCHQFLHGTAAEQSQLASRTNYGDAYTLTSATSYHQGGVNVSLADGSVRFVTNSINTGNSSSPQVTTGPSPYGIWGAPGDDQRRRK